MGYSKSFNYLLQRFPWVEEDQHTIGHVLLGGSARGRSSVVERILRIPGIESNVLIRWHYLQQAFNEACRGDYLPVVNSLLTLYSPSLADYDEAKGREIKNRLLENNPELAGQVEARDKKEQQARRGQLGK